MVGQAQQHIQAESVKREARAAFSGGVRFVFVRPLAALEEDLAVEASSSLGAGAKWRLLREGEEYNLAWEDKQDGTAQVTITLPHANAKQSFLRWKIKR